MTRQLTVEEQAKALEWIADLADRLEMACDCRTEGCDICGLVEGSMAFLDSIDGGQRAIGLEPAEEGSSDQ